ncbi:glycosyltransferase [Sporolactobacillus sp. THM7-4]|nr:glycosyltransferase [Sporolactobacillus sp. THM7-4]
MFGTILTIVVPCFNEEEVLPETNRRLRKVLSDAAQEYLISDTSQILYVDDGSSDRTWDLISQFSEESRQVSGLKLSRNFGHQQALIAGMETARLKSDCVITIDADLQDDVRAIREFLIKYHEGCDVVYGVRRKRETDTFFKRNSALAFYKIMDKLGVRLIPNHADFRLLSRRALDEFVKYQEENVFIRGIIPELGFKSAKVYYDRLERYAGRSKYPLKKMIQFALDGLTSFTITPIRMVTYLGATFVVIAILMIGYTLIQHFIGRAVTGWSSIILSIWLIGGIQLTAIGVIGEYIGKIFKETKHRPRYTIEENLFLYERQARRVHAGK